MSYVIRYAKPIATKVRLNNIFAISSFQGKWEPAEEVVNGEDFDTVCLALIRAGCVIQSFDILPPVAL